MSIWKKPNCIITASLLAILGLSRTDFGDLMQISPWNLKSPMPTSRNLLAVCEVNGHLYAIGGARTATISTTAVEVYDPATDTWSKKADSPSVGCAFAACLVNNKIFLFGGASVVYGAVTSGVYEFNPAMDSWTMKADMPTPRAYMSASVVDGKIYVIGGATEAGAYAVPCKTVEMYDPATDTWQKKSNMPTARFAHAVSVVDGKIYVFGGAENGRLVGLSAVEAYDPAKDSWNVKTDMPIAKVFHAAAVAAGKVYVISGSSGTSDIYQSVEEYDPISNLWRIRSAMRSNRWGLSTGVAGGKVYAIGGATIANTRLSTVEEYVPEAEPRGVSTLEFIPGAEGAAIFSTVESDGPTRTGYAAVTLGEGAVPYGTAVFSLRQNGVIVSEAGVPASPPIRSARIMIDYRSVVSAVPGRTDAGSIDINTGIAVVNLGTAAANVTYTLRNTSGDTLSIGHGIVAANAHFARFINQLQDVAPDFGLPSDFPINIRLASLEIASSQPLSILALRQTTNQRNETLFTTTPIADLAQPLANSPVYFPQLADGGGYITSLLLLNTSNGTETGTLQFLDDQGVPLIINPVEGAANSSFKYSIPAGGAFQLQTDGSPTTTRTGWAQLTPDAGTSTPIGSGVFSFSNQGILVTESGVPATASTTHARVYVDLSSGHNTGLALAAPGNKEASVSVSAFQRDGVTPIGTSQGPLRLPASGHIAKFAGEFISGLPTGFCGVLDISSTTPLAALTMRSLSNQRSDFLLTTFPIADISRAAPSPIVFPQIADGGGYVTEFILLSTGKASQMTLHFSGEDGTPLPVGK